LTYYNNQYYCVPYYWNGEIGGNFACGPEHSGLNFNELGQEPCSSSWYGAAQYVRARPKWNSSTKQCEACKTNSRVIDCTEAGQSDIWTGSFWDGEKCVNASVGGTASSGSDTGMGTPKSTAVVGSSSVGEYNLPTCKGSSLLCNITCYHISGADCQTAYWYPDDSAWDDISYYNDVLDVEVYPNLCRRGGFANTCLTEDNVDDNVWSIYNSIPRGSAGAIHGPYDKGYVALQELGISPEIADPEHVNVHY
jgi:hypothetical protein